MNYLVLHNNRYPDLQLILAGYKKFGIPLLGYDGNYAVPFKTDDDIGLYVFIPKICKFFNLSLESCAYIFFHGVLTIGLITAFIIFWHLYQNKLQRMISFLGLIIFSYLLFRISDVYSISSIYAVTIIPSFLLLSRNKAYATYLPIFLFISGLLVGLANTMRAYAGISIFIILMFQILALQIKMKRKLIYNLILLIGILIPHLYIQYEAEKYMYYANHHLEKVPTLIQRHPFWHTFYLGFGFLNCLNSSGVKWDDKYGFDKAKQIYPDSDDFYVYDYSKYEAVMRNETWNLFKHHSFAVWTTIFAKIGVLIFYLIKYVNIYLIGLIWAIRRRFFSFSIVGWSMAVSFNALYPIIAIPYVEYSVSFITLTILFAIIETNESINFYGIPTLFSRLLRRKDKILININ